MTQLSDEVVERVARALFEHEWAGCNPVPEEEWGSSKEYWLAGAEVAIAAYEAKGDVVLDEG